MSFNTSLFYCSTLDSSHAPSPWVSVEVLLLYVRGLTKWVYNRSNKQSTTIIFIWLDRMIIDAMSGGVGVGVLPSWRQQGRCRGQPIGAGLARVLCVLCCAIWWKAAPLDSFLHPMQVRSHFCPCKSSILVTQSGWAAGSGVPPPHKGNGWQRPKSELKGKNPIESMKILMLNEICSFILTQAENPNSKD